MNIEFNKDDLLSTIIYLLYNPASTGRDPDLGKTTDYLAAFIGCDQTKSLVESITGED